MEEKRDIFAAKREAKRYLAEMGSKSGVGVGDNRIRIYLVSEEERQEIPDSFGGYPVEFIVTGRIKFYGDQAEKS